MNGTNANLQIRRIKEDDILELNFIRTLKQVTPVILSVPTEAEHETFKFFFENDLKHTLVAQIDDKVVGYIRLLLEEHQRKRHMGKISMAVSPNYQHIGIGGKLMDEMVLISINWFALSKLSLTVLVKNMDAVSLYKNKGFVEEGVLKRDTMLDGCLEDVYAMGKYL